MATSPTNVENVSYLIAKFSPYVNEEILNIHRFIDYSDLAGKGLETDPHVTVLHGIHGDSPKQIQFILRDSGPLAIRARNYGKFENEEFDVLYLGVESSGLRDVHNELEKIVPNTQTHSGYKPHITIAYLKKGLADKYISALPTPSIGVIGVDFFEFSDWERNKTKIHLDGEFLKFSKTSDSVHYQQGQVDEQGNLHAPTGGVTIGGKFFGGGKFITKEDLKNASPQELQMLKLQFAGDSNAEKVLDSLASGGDGGGPSESEEQDALAVEWGKPIQVNAGNFLIRQVQSLKNAGFNVSVDGDSREDQVRQAARQLKQMAPLMRQFIDAASSLGFRPSRAQGLVARVNNATHNIFKKAESLGWKSEGNFKERFKSASDFLIAKGGESDRVSKLKGEVAEAALRLGSRVLKVPLAKAFGGKFNGDSKTELKQAADFLKAIQDGITADSEIVRAELVQSEGDDEEKPEPKADDETEDAGEPLAELDPVKLPMSWDDIPNFDADLRRLMADSLGLKDVSPLGYQRNLALLQESQQKAVQKFYKTHGAIANAIGGKNLKAMAREAKEAIKGGSFRGLDSLVASIEKTAPGAISAISGGADKGKTVLNWLANSSGLKEPSMNSSETIEEYKNHPAVAGYRDYATAMNSGLVEEDSEAEPSIEETPEAKPETFSGVKDYSYEDHAAIRDATGMDLDPSDYKALSPYLTEAQKIAQQEYQDTHGALKDAIGSKQLPALRRKAINLLKPKGKDGKVGDAADLRGFDLILDRVKENASGALDAIRGDEDESTALLEWLAEGSKVKPPKRDDDRVVDIFASLPDVQRYVGGDYSEDEGDFDEDEESIPFNRPGRKIKYRRHDFGYSSQSESSFNCGNCRFHACGKCLLYDRRNTFQPTKYALDPAVSEDGICDWYETQGRT